MKRRTALAAIAVAFVGAAVHTVAPALATCSGADGSYPPLTEETLIRTWERALAEPSDDGRHGLLWSVRCLLYAPGMEQAAAAALSGHMAGWLIGAVVPEWQPGRWELATSRTASAAKLWRPTIA